MCDFGPEEKSALAMETGPCCVKGSVTRDGKIKEAFCFKYSLKVTGAFSSTVEKSRDLEGVRGNILIY